MIKDNWYKAHVRSSHFNSRVKVSEKELTRGFLGVLFWGVLAFILCI